MYIYITRHGMTKWNEEDKLQGHQDSPLTRQGIDDALALKTVISNYPIECVYSSPLSRAYQTEKLIFPTIAVKIDDRLKEMNFGIYEGKSIEMLKTQTLYNQLWNEPEKFTRIPNGESYDEVFNRVNNFFE